MSDSLNISLKFGSEKHRKVLEALLARKRLSENKMNNITEGLNRSDEMYRCYVNETDADAQRAANRDAGEEEFTTVHVPYSYAMLLSAHTYWTSVFLGRSPILQYVGRHGEGEMQVQAVEALMNYQVHVGGMIAPMYVWLHDAPKYKFGVVWSYWDRETIQTSRIVKEPKTFMGVPLPGTERKIKRTVRIPGYEGHRLMNVSPYDYLPDPRVPITDTQRGEFVGRRVKISWNDLVRGRSQERYFNLDVVKNIKQIKEKMQHWRNEKGGLVLPEDNATGYGPSEMDLSDVDMKVGFEMVVDLIPRDWGLGSAETPEKWTFTVIEDLVVIEARPQGALHNEFPASVIQYELDGHNFVNRSMLEVLEPLSNTMNWLFNSHFFNVRAALNNQFVFDPYRVVVKDLTRRGAGKLIRLKETAYGTDVRQAITQLPVADVTQNHIREAQAIAEMMQRAVGVNDNIMGMVNSGGRKSATEIRTSSTMGINRLKTIAEYWSTTFEGLSQRMLQGTQQYYSAEREFRIAGDLMRDAEQTMRITPEDIAGFYDFVPVDGTMPVDRYAMANLWRETLMGITKIPGMASQYNIPAMFEWMAQLAGMKNIRQFRINIMSDQAALQQAEAGNIVPLGGNNARAERANPSGDENYAGRNAEPSQVSGMGPSG